MPIITPAFPEQNSTFNVTKSTKQVLTSEFQEALNITLEVMTGTATWDKLFAEVNFFSKYKHFLVLRCMSDNNEDHVVFTGLVESKIRILIGNLERNVAVNLCHVNPKQYTPREDAQLDPPFE